MRIHSRVAVLACALSFGALFATREARADSSVMGVSVGALLGAAFPSASGASGRLAWGVEGDYDLLPQISTGLYFLSSSQDLTIPAVGATPAESASTRISLYGVQGSFHFPYPGLAAGARLGIAHNSTSILNGSAGSDNSFSVGPYVSYDFSLTPLFSVGGDAGILFVTTSNSYNIVNLLGTLKAHF